MSFLSMSRKSWEGKFSDCWRKHYSAFGKSLGSKNIRGLENSRLAFRGAVSCVFVKSCRLRVHLWAGIDDDTQKSRSHRSYRTITYSIPFSNTATTPFLLWTIRPLIMPTQRIQSSFLPPLIFTRALSELSRHIHH